MALLTSVIIVSPLASKSYAGTDAQVGQQIISNRGEGVYLGSIKPDGSRDASYGGNTYTLPPGNSDLIWTVKHKVPLPKGTVEATISFEDSDIFSRN